VQREAKIYAGYALMGVALFLYATSFAINAWERFGVSGTFAVYVGASLLFAALTVLGFWLAFIFSARSLLSLRRVSGGFELLPAKHRTLQPVRVQHLRHIRTIGKQFAKDESVPAFAILAAGGRVWVAEASSYQAANAGSAQ
jgi:hypothetical protein